MLLNRLKALLNYISISGEIKKKQIFLGCPRIGGMMTDGVMTMMMTVRARRKINNEVNKAILCHTLCCYKVF